jgi:E3 ubiquitin-protein ligase UBR3
MFLSQAGGACDCGDTSVMKAEGFCSDHGNDCADKRPVPPDLMCVAKAMMPRLLLRLLLHFRDHHSTRGSSYNYERAAKDCEEYCTMLMDFNKMGELMRKIMTHSLIDPEVRNFKGSFECTLLMFFVLLDVQEARSLAISQE